MDNKRNKSGSVVDFSLNEKIELNRFNSLEMPFESLSKYQESVYNSFAQANFASSVFGYMIYLIKRQQSLSGFIQDFHTTNAASERVSLRSLIASLLENCDDAVRTKIYKLLSIKNPVPFCNASSDEFFCSDAHWITQKSDIKIASLGLESDCKGKSKLINAMFATSFEENEYAEGDAHFDATVDLQIVKQFGSALNYCVIDVHGVADEAKLAKLVPFCDAVLVHIRESSLQKSKYLKALATLMKGGMRLLFIVVRDSKSDERSNCTNQEVTRQAYSTLRHLARHDTSQPLICRLPRLSRDSQLKNYSSSLREFVHEHVGTLSTSLGGKSQSAAAAAAVYEPRDDDRIKLITSHVQPVCRQLGDAIRSDGIMQTDLFDVYQPYYEYNHLYTELNKIAFFAENSERIQDLRVRAFDAHCRLEEARKNSVVQGSSSSSSLYSKLERLLKSPHYVLMADIVSGHLASVFRAELDRNVKEKECIVNKLRNNGEKDDGCLDRQRQLDALNELIDMKRISMDVIWRELMLRCNAEKQFGGERGSLIRDTFLHLIYKGQPFEILDGDNFRFHDQFLLSVFAHNNNNNKQLNPRIRVVSILGPQNSGKSTLLNFMFGCDFAVSDGRCTRGIYGTLVRVTDAAEFDYLLVLDTEGLQSIEKSDREYDRKLILFAFAVSNIVILNTKDQITDDFKTTIEVCVDSLTKIGMVRTHRPAVYFVMNQKADPNKRTDQEAISKIIGKLKLNACRNSIFILGKLSFRKC